MVIKSKRYAAQLESRDHDKINNTKYVTNSLEDIVQLL